MNPHTGTDAEVIAYTYAKSAGFFLPARATIPGKGGHNLYTL